MRISDEERRRRHMEYMREWRAMKTEKVLVAEMVATKALRNIDVAMVYLEDIQRKGAQRWKL